MTAFRPGRRIFTIASMAAGVAAACDGLPAFAQGAYPSRPVTMVMPYPPGGIGDALARRLSARLAEIWSVPVVVDNRSGAAGLVGANYVAKGPQDGHTLLFTIPETLAITKASGANVELDPLNELQAIALVSLSTVVLLVNSNSPLKTFRDFMEFAKRNPGRINFGIQGTGSGFHLALEQLKVVTGMDLTAVPYKGAAPAMTDLLGGQIDAMLVSMAAALAYLQAGKLRAIAVAGKDRLSQLPGVPTIAESGYPGYDASVGLAVFVRAGTPAPIIDTLAQVIGKVMHEPAMTAWLEPQATFTTDLTPAQFGERMRRDTASYQALIERAHIKFE